MEEIRNDMNWYCWG